MLPNRHYLACMFIVVLLVIVGMSGLVLIPFLLGFPHILTGLSYPICLWLLIIPWVLFWPVLGWWLANWMPARCPECGAMTSRRFDKVSRTIRYVRYYCDTCDYLHDTGYTVDNTKMGRPG